MATNPQWKVPEPEDITRKNLLVINERITDHHTNAVQQLMVPATKLAPTEDVNELLDLLCAADNELIGRINAIAHRRVSKLNGITTPSRIISNHRKHIREWLREERLDSQLSLFDDETLWSLMYDGLILKHGWRTLCVPGKQVFKAKSKWPYLRFIKDATPSDYRANLSTQRTVVNQGRDASKAFELILLIAKRLNPEGYAKNLEMAVLLKPPSRDKDSDK